MFNKAFSIFMTMFGNLFSRSVPSAATPTPIYQAPYPVGRTGSSGVRAAKRAAAKRRNRSFMKRTGKL